MRALSILAALVLPTLVQAQEFVGFDKESFGRVVLKRNQVVVIDREDGSTPALTPTASEELNEPITNYAPESAFAQMGRSVGRLDILTDAGVFPCTAFIVDADHILTNYHCIPGVTEDSRVGATRIDAALFWAGYTQQGVEEGARSYTVLPTPVEASEKLDYAVLRVIGDPSEDYGFLELASAQPVDGAPYFVVGHPLGEAQRISRDKCRANRPAVSGGRLLHTCATLPGNSGSPVIDNDARLVIGLHSSDSGSDAVNMAVPMAEILANSQVLKAAMRSGVVTPTQPPAPGPQANLICDKLYEKAEALDQCYAYEAYLGTCADHPFAVLAKGYVDNQCADAPATPPTPVVTPPTPTPTPTPSVQWPSWCSASRLNPTESTICSDPYLAGLDSDLNAAYSRPARSVTSQNQGAWRTGTRDACGADASCIARVVLDRISYLRSPAPSGGSTGGSSGGSTGTVPGNYELSSSCYIVTASRPSLSEAKAFIQQWFGNGAGVRVFKSSNGYYGISVETVSKSSADSRIAQLKSAGRIPGDSYCSTGSRFVEEVLWNGGSTGNTGGGSGYTMYIDNTSSLNVRAGPGTDYGRITAVDRGTQVTVIGSSGDWANIRVGGTTGWVSAKYLSSSKPSAQRQCYATVTNLNPYSSRTRADGSGYLNVRSQPSTRSAIVSETYLGDTMRVYAQSNGWAQVSCVQGQCLRPYNGSGSATGWASAKYLAVRCN